MGSKIIRKTDVVDAFSLASRSSGLIVAPQSIFKALCFVVPQETILLEQSETRTIKVYAMQHFPLSKVVKFNVKSLYPLREYRVKKSKIKGIEVIKGIVRGFLRSEQGLTAVSSL